MQAIRTQYLAMFLTVLFFGSIAQAKGIKHGGYFADPLTRTLTFAPNQSVRLEVNVGDIHILPSLDDNQLRLEIQPNQAISSGEVQSWIEQFDVGGSQATIRLHMPKSSNQSGTMTLYVPASTALHIDLGVGGLAIDGISGDKDLLIGVGDLKLGGLHPGDYGIVKNSTGIGDVNDSIFPAQQSGWLGKSDKALGSGPYHIRTHVGVGSIHLQKETLSGTD